MEKKKYTIEKTHEGGQRLDFDNQFMILYNLQETICRKKITVDLTKQLIKKAEKRNLFEEKNETRKHDVSIKGSLK